MYLCVVAKSAVKIVSADNKLPLGPEAQRCLFIRNGWNDDYIDLNLIFLFHLFYLLCSLFLCTLFVPSIYHSACTLKAMYLCFLKHKPPSLMPSKLYTQTFLSRSISRPYFCTTNPPPGGDNYDTLESSCRLATAVKVQFYWLCAECGPKCCVL